MEEDVKTVFGVRRCLNTKSARVGDYETFSDAETAMIEHFKNNPKRGKISYIIAEEELLTMDGIRFRRTSIVWNGNKPTYRAYSAKELYARL